MKTPYIFTYFYEKKNIKPSAASAAVAGLLGSCAH